MTVLLKLCLCEMIIMNRMAQEKEGDVKKKKEEEEVKKKRRRWSRRGEGVDE